jgi:hypothetical protein
LAFGGKNPANRQPPTNSQIAYVQKLFQNSVQKFVEAQAGLDDQYPWYCRGFGMLHFDFDVCPV